jgi:N-acetylglucosaminyl-diphospho-decaprenol L-rhamnosyltransferase
MASPTPSSNAPVVAVVTVSFGSGDVIPTFLDSVPSASTSPLQVVVVDNIPEGDPLVQSQTHERNATYASSGVNRGYGGAVNSAVAQLAPSVRWILVSNPDVMLSAGSIDTMVAVGEEDATIGSIGPAVLNSDGSVYPSARSVPSLRTGVGHALFANLWTSNPWSAAYKNESTDEVTRRDAGWLSGSCVLVRREAFELLGGFDDGYFMYFEDVDLGYRLGKAGYRNVYEPTATVVHTGAHSTTSDSANMVRAHHESAKRFLNTKYRGPLLWPVRAALRAGLAVRSALVVRKLGH